MMPSISSLLSRSAEKKEQGQVLGMNQSFGSLARVIGPTLGGFLYGWHYTSPYIGGAIMMVGALLFVLAFQRSARSRAIAANATGA